MFEWGWRGRGSLSQHKTYEARTRIKHCSIRHARPAGKRTRSHATTPRGVPPAATAAGGLLAATRSMYKRSLGANIPSPLRCAAPPHPWVQKRFSGSPRRLGRLVR